MTLERFGLRVGPAVRQRSAHIEAFEHGAWIGAHAPTSPAYREIRVLKDRILELLADAARAPEHEPAPTPPVTAAGRTFGRRVNWSPHPAPMSPSAG
jgi:hypothetical protein